MLLADYAFWLYMSPGTALNLASGTFEHHFLSLPGHLLGYEVQKILIEFE